MACSEKEFIALCKQEGSTTRVAEILGIANINVQARRKRIYKRSGLWLNLDARGLGQQIPVPQGDVRQNAKIKDGVIIVGSDAHYWPNLISTAHRAMVSLIDKLKPNMFILNGDSFDGPTAGRFGRINWDQQPTVAEELEAVTERLGEIESVSPSDCDLWHMWGNHDLRFNTTLSGNVAQYEGVPGMNFCDHLPAWKFAMSLMINDNTMIKHRWHGGVHAAYNNVLKSGRNIITGHLHALKVMPYTDYNGSRYAVDTGTLADPHGIQFKYAEDNPCNHRSGFAILTFQNGDMMPPELCEVIDEKKGVVFFRGSKFNV